MTEPLPPALEQKAQALAQRIHSRSAGAILEMARRLVASSDDTLFGDTEFAVRDAALGVAADAYAEHLEKKVAMSGRPSNAPTAAAPPPSTATAPKRSRASAVRSGVSEPTTTAGCAAQAPARGTNVSD